MYQSLSTKSEPKSYNTYRGRQILYIDYLPVTKLFKFHFADGTYALVDKNSLDVHTIKEIKSSLNPRIDQESFYQDLIEKLLKSPTVNASTRATFNAGNKKKPSPSEKLAECYVKNLGLQLQKQQIEIELQLARVKQVEASRKVVKQERLQPRDCPEAFQFSQFVNFLQATYTKVYEHPLLRPLDDQELA